MNKILILGAGRSTTDLIDYMLEQAAQFEWEVTVADGDVALADQKINGRSQGKSMSFDVLDPSQRKNTIASADIVISMLPFRFHSLVASECLELKKSLVTASYTKSMVNPGESDDKPLEVLIEEKLADLDKEAKANGLIFLNAIGLDPGIDHMSAKKIIDDIKAEGGTLTSFKSFTGGLIAPESDNNPWGYKFTWNPRNVVLAGQGVAQYIKNNRYKYIPYHNVFNRLEKVDILDFGTFEAYANRDSLSYREGYGLNDIPTIFRGTLRRPGFCRAWNIFVQLGMTDSTYTIEDSENMSYREFVNTFLLYRLNQTIEAKLAKYVNIDPDGEEMEKLSWLGLFSDEKIGLKNATPAQILQHILENKWSLQPNDKDMIVMQHQFEYMLDDRKEQIISSMGVIGKNHDYTAMSKTVGLPIGIAVKLILTGTIKLKGLQIPVSKEIYDPVLKELEGYDITFIDDHKTL